MKMLKPNTQRGKVAITCIWVIFCVNIFSLLLEGMNILMNENIIHPVTVPEELITIISFWLSYSTILYVITYIISIIFFLMWLRRAYHNLGQKLGRLDYGDGWTVASWFIPFANLFIPYKIMKELYKKTDRYLMSQIEIPYPNRLKTDYVTGWWALIIIIGILTNISTKFEGYFSNPQNVGDNLYISLLLSALQIVLCVVTLIIIQDYTEAEKLLIEIEENENGMESQSKILATSDN